MLNVFGKNRILIVDSHCSEITEKTVNMHARNSLLIAESLGGTLAGSLNDYREVEPQKWEKIIFVHASAYEKVDHELTDNNPDADLFYITNEYNLGEPHLIWRAAKAGKKYTVIANHEPEASKIVKKYVGSWENVNLNALIYSPQKRPISNDLFEIAPLPCVYYGAFRKDRTEYFRKYFDDRLHVSSSKKNHHKMAAAGMQARFIDKLQWSGEKARLWAFTSSLYLEDKKTHKHYNRLGNRFYEALNHGVQVLFDVSCKGSVDKSGYEIPKSLFVDGSNELYKAVNEGFRWSDEIHAMAAKERQDAIEKIKKVVNR